MTNRYNNRRQYFDELARTSKEYLSEYIRSYNDLSPGNIVLEIGCGEGGNLVPFAEEGCQVYGIDISAGKIETQGNSLQIADLRELSYAVISLR